MNADKHIERRKPSSKGLLIAVLLLGFFSLSGGNLLQPHQKPLSKTEQVVSVVRIVKRVYPVKETDSNRWANPVSLIRNQIIASTLSASRLSDVKRLDVLKKTLRFKRFTEHFASALIPHSSDEDHLKS